MGLNFVERGIVKLVWKRMEGKMPAIKRWAPVLGSLTLAGAVILRLFGQAEAAKAIESLGGLVGLTQQSPVGVVELTAAGTALAGIVLKVRSEIRKARARKDTVQVR